MSTNTNLAFQSAEARAAATAGDDPLDRIAVRDYTKDVEIGAFQTERGVTQRIRFNVVVEVSRIPASKVDDVDQILSYDTITDAIEHQLGVERLNLLETLAERIADEVLLNSRAVKVFVRIEKLDRIPGQLGVEIVRSRRVAEDLSTDDELSKSAPAEVHPLVVFMPNTVLHSARVTAWLDAIAAHDDPAVICVEQANMPMPRADVEAACKRIGLLAIEQNAWVLAGKDKRCVVVDSRTEMDWAMKNGQMSVWAPSKMVLDAVNKPNAGADKPLALARWFAAEFSADHVTILEGFATASDKANQRIIPTPEEL